MLLIVDFCDLCINDLSLFENIGRVSELLVCYLGDVDKSVDAGNDLSKRSEGHKRRNLYGYDIAYVVLCSEECPGVCFLCLVTEGNSALFTVEALDEYVKRITDGTTSFGFEIWSQVSSEL